MFKKLILLLAVTLLVLSHNLLTEDNKVIRGGYKHSEGHDNQNDDLNLIETFARESFAKTNEGVQLGPLVLVQTQLVAGTNYKLFFASPVGMVQIIVFDQPWSNTREIKEVKIVPRPSQ